MRRPFYVVDFVVLCRETTITWSLCIDSTALNLYCRNCHTLVHSLVRTYLFVLSWEFIQFKSKKRSTFLYIFGTFVCNMCGDFCAKFLLWEWKKTKPNTWSKKRGVWMWHVWIIGEILSPKFIVGIYKLQKQGMTIFGANKKKCVQIKHVEIFLRIFVWTFFLWTHNVFVNEWAVTCNMWNGTSGMTVQWCFVWWIKMQRMSWKKCSFILDFLGVEMWFRCNFWAWNKDVKDWGVSFELDFESIDGLEYRELPWARQFFWIFQDLQFLPVEYPSPVTMWLWLGDFHCS